MTETEITLEEAKEPITDKKPSKETKEQVDNIVDLLKPKSDPHKVTLSHNGQEATYVQKPLSYFGKLEFYATIADAVDVALQTGLSINSLTNIAPGIGAQDLTDADSFVIAVAKLAKYAPDILKDSYCIWLDIPFEDRPWAKEALNNLSDDEGTEIIEVFIDQNYEDIENFFREKIQKIWRRIQEARKGISQRSSNNSKVTQRTTRKKSKTS